VSLAKFAHAYTGKKVSKAEADYVDESTYPGKTCAACEYYGDGNCIRVEGEISSKGWCKFFEKDDRSSLPPQAPKAGQKEHIQLIERGSVPSYG